MWGFIGVINMILDELYQLGYHRSNFGHNKSNFNSLSHNKTNMINVATLCEDKPGRNHFIPMIFGW